MNNTRLLLLNAIDNSASIESCFPNLGLGYIANFLRREALFGEFKVISGNIAREVGAWKPDVVGITAVSQNYGKAMEYAKIVKNFGLPVIMGGVHISALPQTLSPHMDIAVLGEGEQTMVELMKLYHSEGSFFDHGVLRESSLQHIDGLAYRYAGKMVLTKPRSLVQPLDNLPFPDRSILRIGKSTNMFTSRGCPYRCTFCFSSRFWNRVRFFSAEYVVEEIAYLHSKYGVTGISLLDDLFIADRARLTRIVDLLGKRNLLGKISYICNARSNLVTDDLAKLLRAMGIKTVGMGLESGCQQTLEYLKGKGTITVQDHARAVQILRKNKIALHCSFIIGSPLEDEAAVRQTIAFVKDNKITSFDVYVLTPLPGTPVWEYAKARGLVSNDMDWSRLSVNISNKNPIILSEKLSKEEIFCFYQQLIDKRSHYSLKNLILAGLEKPNKIPGYIWRKLNV